MKIVFSDSTAVGAAAPKPKGKGAADAVAGARYLRSTKKDGERDLYALVPLDDVDYLLEKPEDAVVGDFEEAIEAEIVRRHPAPRPGTSTVWRVNNAEITLRREDLPAANRNDKSGRTITVPRGWVVLDCPYVTSAEDEPTVRKLSLALGPLYMAESEFGHVFGGTDAAADLGFTAVRRKVNGRDLVRVNYNPDARRRREYRRRRAEADRRLAGDFPDEVTHSIYALLHPEKMGHDFGRHVGGAETYTKRGWGNRTRVHFSTDDCLQLLRLAKRLGVKEPYWRGASAGPYEASEYRRFKDALEAAFQVIHGVERAARAAVAEKVQELSDGYVARGERCELYAARKREWLETHAWEDDGGSHLDYREETREIQHGPHAGERYVVDVPHDAQPAWVYDFEREWWSDAYSDEPTHTEPRPYAEELGAWVLKRLPKQAARAYDKLRFCRWLRHEGRAVGVKVPRPPKLPKPPPTAAERAKARKAKRHKRRDRKQDVFDFVKRAVQPRGRDARKAG